MNSLNCEPILGLSRFADAELDANFDYLFNASYDDPAPSGSDFWGYYGNRLFDLGVSTAQAVINQTLLGTAPGSQQITTKPGGGTTLSSTLKDNPWIVPVALGGFLLILAMRRR